MRRFVRGPLSLGTRVGLAVGGALFVVLLTYGLALHHFLQSAVAGWERENLAALGHHAADMVAAVPPGEREAATRRLAQELDGFGVALRWLAPAMAPDEPPAPGVRVPVGEEGGELHLATSRPARESLGRRLLTLYAFLFVALVTTLAVVVQASVYWGVLRPLRTVRRQLRQMHRGPWRTTAGGAGAAEVVSLAREVEAVGLTLDRRVPEWVEAERKAGTELARRRLRAAVLPELRELNVLLSDVLARSDTSPVAVRALRRAQDASDRIAGHLDSSADEELTAPSRGARARRGSRSEGGSP